MTASIPSLSVSSAPTKSLEEVVSPPGAAPATETTTLTCCQVYSFEAYGSPSPQIPAKHTTIRDLVGQWEQDRDKRSMLEEGRRWVARTFYGEEGDTVRTVRLRKGWSQTRLAEALGTSQSHVARIERGTENLTIETCRRLAMALSIDMNTLDTMLKRQEALARAKQK